ncbi:hypothetical protein [Bacteroides sp.]|jgi:hypothetical protein|uniref:hypothetical protein n=1 Tax=Bacteroides sp. TaxID=29523 RepID=UPI0025B9E466|nr:hypothetical protein [Bacteroides sp.]
MSISKLNEEISNINKVLGDLAKDIEQHYNLIPNNPYQVHTLVGDVYNVYYVGWIPRATKWDKEARVDILFRFHKMKKNGTVSRLWESFYAKEVKNIVTLPF